MNEGDIMSVAIYYYYVLTTTRRYDDALSTKKVLTSISWYDLNAGRDATRDEFFPVPGLSDITFILHAYWRWPCSGVWQRCGVRERDMGGVCV